MNLAFHMEYEGVNMVFVFYKIRFSVLCMKVHTLSNPSSFKTCWSTKEDTKVMTMSTQIEKTFVRLKERYGVPGGLTSEPKVMNIRHGQKISFNVASMKAFNEELNFLETPMLMKKHKKLSGQLTLDTKMAAG